MDGPALHPATSVDVVIPAHDEQDVLATSTLQLHRCLEALGVTRWQITIAENASTDRTAEVARELVASLPNVRSLHRPTPGRGGALREAWSTSDADVLAYVDADQSTDLTHLSQLLATVASGDADLAIGSRLLPGAEVRRRPGREIISRSYNAVLRGVLRTSIRDAQCGFKAISADAARELLPRVADDGWFFDTELIVAAERAGRTVAELPVRWTEDTNSSVRILSTALADLRGVARLARAPR